MSSFKPFSKLNGDSLTVCPRSCQEKKLFTKRLFFKGSFKAVYYRVRNVRIVI
jgi:hypothetical protein